jgi:PilZ domain
MNFDRRSETRVRVKLPVFLPGGECGLTRDVSAGGLSFEFSGCLEAGSTIELSIALPDDDRPMRLKALGMVVRVEPRGTGYGVGIWMLTSTLQEVGHAPINSPQCVVH